MTTYVPNPAINVTKLLKTEQPSAVGTVIENIALWLMSAADGQQQYGQERPVQW